MTYSLMSHAEPDGLVAKQRPTNHEVVAQDLRDALKGKVPQAVLERATAKIAEDVDAYQAGGSVLSAVFYIDVTLAFAYAFFHGTAGGITSPFVSGITGNLYVSDIDRMVSDTRSFEFQSAAAYFSMFFFDGQHDVLAHFQALGFGTVQGVGGGSGRWSR